MTIHLKTRSINKKVHMRSTQVHLSKRVTPLRRHDEVKHTQRDDSLRSVVRHNPNLPTVGILTEDLL